MRSDFRTHLLPEPGPHAARQRLRIALIAPHYPPLRTSAAVQLRDLAVELLRGGHEPVVIVPTETLDQPWAVEVLDGVQVLRVLAPRTQDIGYVRRTLSEFALPFLMIRRIRRSPFALTAWDLAAWYSPTIFFGPLVWWLKRTSGCRTYLILRDIFPEWAVDLGIMRKGPAYAAFKAVAHLQYSVADVIGVQTPSNLGYMASWAGRPDKRVEVLHNWQTPAPDVGSSIRVAGTPLAGRRIAVYVGNMGVAQGMDVMLDLAESMAHRDDVGFLFVGRGSEVPRLKARVASAGLRNTLFFDEVDSSEMPGLLAQCFVGLLALDPRHRTHNIPGKFLTYLNTGLPVLARVNAGNDLETLINDERVGVAVHSESAAPLKDEFERLLADPAAHRAMAERGRDLSQRMFSTASAVRHVVGAVTGVQP